jgi:hypothetical protein
MIFDYIKAAKFFPKYAPTVKAWKKKISGKNSNGNPIDFTEADKVEIKKGLKEFLRDINRKNA